MDTRIITHCRGWQLLEVLHSLSICVRVPLAVKIWPARVAFSVLVLRSLLAISLLAMRSALRLSVAQSRRSFSTGGVLSAPSAASSIQRIGVVGAGQMGGGIGIVAAVQAKLRVLMVDVSAEGLARNTAFTRALLEKDVKKGKMTQAECEEAIQRITTSTNMDAVSRRNNRQDEQTP